MNAQLTFLAEPAPYVRTSETSRAAAESISDCEFARKEIVRYCRLNYGCTDQELQAAFGWSGDFERPRRVSLVKDGLLVDSGRTRKTTSGRNATVWESV